MNSEKKKFNLKLQIINLSVQSNQSSYKYIALHIDSKSI